MIISNNFCGPGIVLVVFHYKTSITDVDKKANICVRAKTKVFDLILGHRLTKGTMQLGSYDYCSHVKLQLEQ